MSNRIIMRCLKDEGRGCNNKGFKNPAEPHVNTIMIIIIAYGLDSWGLIWQYKTKICGGVGAIIVGHNACPQHIF